MIRHWGEISCARLSGWSGTERIFLSEVQKFPSSNSSTEMEIEISVHYRIITSTQFKTDPIHIKQR